ncbi:6-phosphogluconolactonase [Nigerium massiliense]|uniref:6-phosphogluconolactonase n=1 Tax=Nigerium massiliense TaxID=1522317 RepID=UPI000590F993|nr:6-phosphogluconolactonase [Nigerium massiliense]
MTAVHRYADAEALAADGARMLVQQLRTLQKGGRVAQLCLTGGRLATRLFREFGPLVGDLDPRELELWWSSEQFVPTDDPGRNAGPTLALLAGHFTLDPSKTHPMPAADGVTDAVAGAVTYGKELGDTVFDVCLLGVGSHGEVASIFPAHPSFEPTTHKVLGVNDAPTPPSQRISLAVDTLNRSRQVWFLGSGAEKAEVVARAMAGDPALPAGVVRGTEQTVWLLDADAAARLDYYRCSL